MILALVAVSVGGVAAQPNVKSIIINPNPPYQTSIWTDRSYYQPGERLNIYFRTSGDAWVYVFDIDTRGNVSLIFPNIYSDSNHRKANETYVLPDNSRYNLTVAGPAGTEQLVLFAVPSKIRDVEWLRRSLEQGTFSPQVNINVSADKFMMEVKSVVITPNFGQNWSSATTSFSVGPGAPSPPPSPPPPPTPPVVRGSINVTSSPSGSRVFLDGVEQGTTPVTLSGLSAGVHEVVVLRKGYYAFTRSVTITSSNPYQVHANLSRIPDDQPPTSAEVQLISKVVNVKWPNTGPVTEYFSYRGSSGNLVITGDPVLGMMSRVTGSLTVNAVGPIQFVEVTPSGPDAPWPGRVFEKVQYPFRARVTVEDYAVVTGPVFGIEYLDYVRLRVEVWYIGN
jgi:hypothetical protein